jgi:PPK2 family polyphosphate:nucleotide phosphotransferase
MPDRRADQIIRLVEPLRVRPGSRVRLPRDFDPGHTAGFVDKVEAKVLLQLGVELLAEYQERLAAQDTRGLLVVIQAMDAAGKDGTIRHVMSGVNPQGVEVTSFKVPSPEELDHDYLWRAAKRLPARGTIGIFNRSYYEEVLIVRVHPEILAGQKLPPQARGRDIWKTRFRDINAFERHLVDNGFPIVKLFLNVSRGEQRKRFLDRIDEPHANWKFSAGDVRERQRWDDYMAAYGDMISNTSTEWAPWHVIPADHKWFMRLAASAAILDALIRIDPRWPVMSADAKAAMLEAKQQLLAEEAAASMHT